MNAHYSHRSIFERYRIFYSYHSAPGVVRFDYAKQGKNVQITPV